MEFRELGIQGAWEIEIRRIEDERGFFGRAWCADEFAACGLDPRVAQVNVGFSLRRGTLRGLHYQVAPHGEAKLVRCTRGAVFDVLVDLRAESPTHCAWYGTELTEDNHRMLYIPEGCAHGYLTLKDHCEITYQASVKYEPGSACGARYDDPAFAIEWPGEVTVISGQDRSWPLLTPPPKGRRQPW